MTRFLNSFRFAFNGLKYAFGTQQNFKVHIVLGLLAISVGFIFEISISEWLWILLSILMVFIAELFNTAIEVLVDLVSPQYQVKAGIVKDVAAGAVLCAAGFAVITGLIIFLPKLLG